MDSMLYCNNRMQFGDLVEMIILCIKEANCELKINYYNQDYEIVYSGTQLLNNYLYDDSIYRIGIFCDYLSIITEAPKHRSEDYFELYCKEHNVEINMELELDIYVATISKGIKLLKEIVTKIEKSTRGDVVIENDTSVVVYLSSKKEKISVDAYWKM